MRIQTGIILLLVTIFLWGCSPTTKILSWQSEDAGFSKLTAFEIQPVSNETGKAIEPGVLSLLTSELKDKFAQKKLHLSDPSQHDSEIIVVHGEILVYEVRLLRNPIPARTPANYRTSLCILRTRLFQKSSGLSVAEIVTINDINVGHGLLEPTRPEYVLRKSADVVAKEISRMLAHQ